MNVLKRSGQMARKSLVAWTEEKLREPATRESEAA